MTGTRPVITHWFFIDEGKWLYADSCWASTMHVVGTTQQCWCCCGGWGQGSGVSGPCEGGSREASLPARHHACQKLEEKVQRGSPRLWSWDGVTRWHFIWSQGVLIARVLFLWFKPQDHPSSVCMKVIFLMCASSVWCAGNLIQSVTISLER